ncbi:cache domain-containing protein [Nitrospirillum amazonense]|nr:cache domain-containing protein [Nitrospirillum amazonense]
MFCAVAGSLLAACASSGVAPPETYDARAARARQSLDHAVAVVRSSLDPAKLEVAKVAEMTSAGRIDPIDPEPMTAALKTLIRSDGNLRDATILTCDEWVRGLVVQNKSIVPVALDFHDQHKRVRMVFDRDLTEPGHDGYWDDPAFTTINGPSLTVRQRLLYHGAPRGVLIATVSLADISRQFEKDADDTGARSFILSGDRVLAHPTLARAFSAGSPPVGGTAPTVHDLNDRVLAARGSGRIVPNAGPGVGRETAEIVSLDGQDFLIQTRELRGYGPKGQTIGTYVSLADVTDFHGPRAALAQSRP